MGPGSLPLACWAQEGSQALTEPGGGAGGSDGSGGLELAKGALQIGLEVQEILKPHQLHGLHQIGRAHV